MSWAHKPPSGYPFVVLDNGRENMKTKSVAIVTGAICALSSNALAQSDVVEAITHGKSEFMGSCAICHGADAKGDGKYAEYLAVKPADLTQLTAKNNGEFPFTYVYQIIDGRKMPGAHGLESAMPIWGHAFTKEAYMNRPGVSPDQVDFIVQGRILSLVYYLQTLQQ